MGLLSRLKDISSPKLLAFIETSETPELTVLQLQEELKRHKKALHNAEIKSLSATRAAQRRLEETMGRLLRLERGAELALLKGDEDTAREALREQVTVEKLLDSQRQQFEGAQQTLDRVRGQSEVLNKQLNLVKEKQEQLKIQPGAPSFSDSTEPLLNQVAKMEERMITAEAGLKARQEVHQQMRKRSLDERLLELEKNEELEKRLTRIRKDINKDQ